MAKRVPRFLQALVDKALPHVDSDHDEAPLLWTWKRPTRKCPHYVIAFFPTAVEVVGGPKDGARTHPTLSADLGALAELFDEVRAILCGAARDAGVLPEEPPHNPFGVVAGVFRRAEVALYVFQRPNADEEPGLFVGPDGKPLKR
jgi:hypothetical protein